jgi:methylated-DNA-protein-cysteine methyltransferase-like protein
MCPIPSADRHPVSDVSSHQRIYAVVRRIPRGRVATYGQIAVLAGLPRQPRLVGYALSALPDGSRIPWHRVVNAKGAVSLRSDGHGHDQLQQLLLANEGVMFLNRVIPLDRYQWRPRARTAATG